MFSTCTSTIRVSKFVELSVELSVVLNSTLNATLNSTINDTECFKNFCFTDLKEILKEN